MLVEDRGALTLLKPYRVCRREPRYVSSIAVTVQRFLRFGPFFTRGVSLDISTQGMSALVCGAPRVGETVVIELPLRDALIDMLATVRHSTDSKSGFGFAPYQLVPRMEYSAGSPSCANTKNRFFRVRILRGAEQAPTNNQPRRCYSGSSGRP
jgi:PilZ domain